MHRELGSARPPTPGSGVRFLGGAPRLAAMFLALRHAHEWALLDEFRARIQDALVAAGLGP